MPTCTHVSRCNVRCSIRRFSPSCQSAAGCCAAFAPSRNGKNESRRFLTNIPTCRSLQWVFPQTGRDSLCGNSSGSHPPTFVPFAFFVAKNHSPRPPSSGWRASTPANPSGPPRPPSPGKGECFAQTFHSPCPGLARLCGALGHVRSIRSPLVRAQDAHGETATHAPKVMPMTTPSTARPRGGSGASFGVAGFIRGGGPPRPQARPIGHWQHWNWQHFHIGNIFMTKD